MWSCSPYSGLLRWAVFPKPGCGKAEQKGAWGQYSKGRGKTPLGMVGEDRALGRPEALGSRAGGHKESGGRRET